MANYEDVTAFLVETLGLDVGEAEMIHIQSLRCKGNDLKEKMMLHRIIRPVDTYEKDEGYYIQFLTAAHPTRLILAEIGPQEDKEDNATLFNALVRLFDFDKSLIIPTPEELEMNEMFDFEEDFGWDTDDELDELFGDDDDIDALFDDDDDGWD